MRRRLVVSGRVQGVGFRYFVREYARELGLSGRVRNLRDGSVEVEAEGEPDAVEQLVSHLHRGPQGSTITAIEDKPVDDAGTELPNPFAIAR